MVHIASCSAQMASKPDYNSSANQKIIQQVLTLLIYYIVHSTLSLLLVWGYQNSSVKCNSRLLDNISKKIQSMKLIFSHQRVYQVCQKEVGILSKYTCVKYLLAVRSVFGLKVSHLKKSTNLKCKLYCLPKYV